MPHGLTTIGSYNTFLEASLVRSELEAFAVDVFLADAEMVRLNWMWSNALGGVKVQVPESEREEALDILGLEPCDEQDWPELPEAAVSACPACNTEYFLDKRGAFLTLLILGFPVVPAATKRICNDCGKRWKA